VLLLKFFAVTTFSPVFGGVEAREREKSIKDIMGKTDNIKEVMYY
jgi:hypothetical protein